MKKEDPRKSKKSKIRKYILKYIRIVFPIISVVVCLFTVSFNAYAMTYRSWVNGLLDYPYVNNNLSYGQAHQWQSTDLIRSNNVAFYLTPGVDNFSEVRLTTNGQTLATYSSMVFYRDYTYWQPDTTTPSPVGMNTTDSSGVDHGKYHGHFYTYYVCIPRYYTYANNVYDILDLYPRLVSSWPDRISNLYKAISFTSPEAYDFPDSSERQAWLLSPDRFTADWELDSGIVSVGGTSNFYVDGVRDYNNDNNYMYYQCPYFCYYWFLPQSYSELSKLDTQLSLSFQESDVDPKNYVFCYFLSGCPYVLPKSTWQDDEYMKFEASLSSFVAFSDSDGEHLITDYVDIPLDTDVDDPGIHPFDKAVISPFLCLAYNLGSYVTGYLINHANEYTGAPQKLIDYRYAQLSTYGYGDRCPPPDVHIEVDINASTETIADAAIISGLQDLNMSVEAQTLFLTIPDNATQAEMDRISAAMTSSSTGLYDAILEAESHPDLSASDANILFSNIDITSLEGALAWNNSQIVISLIVASMSCAIIGFILYGKRG